MLGFQLIAALGIALLAGNLLGERRGSVPLDLLGMGVLIGFIHPGTARGGAVAGVVLPQQAGVASRPGLRSTGRCRFDQRWSIIAALTVSRAAQRPPGPDRGPEHRFPSLRPEEFIRRIVSPSGADQFPAGGSRTNTGISRSVFFWNSA